MYIVLELGVMLSGANDKVRETFDFTLDSYEQSYILHVVHALAWHEQKFWANEQDYYALNNIGLCTFILSYFG